MKIGIALFSAILLLILVALFGVIEWSTLGFITAITICLVIVGAFGFLIVKSLTKNGSKVEH